MNNSRKWTHCVHLKRKAIVGNIKFDLFSEPGKVEQTVRHNRDNRFVIKED